MSSILTNKSAHVAFLKASQCNARHGHRIKATTYVHVRRAKQIYSDPAPLRSSTHISCFKSQFLKSVHDYTKPNSRDPHANGEKSKEN
jgi:hypothetical protein